MAGRSSTFQSSKNDSLHVKRLCIACSRPEFGASRLPPATPTLSRERGVPALGSDRVNSFFGSPESIQFFVDPLQLRTDLDVGPEPGRVALRQIRHTLRP